jgi:hypothetical protein
MHHPDVCNILLVIQDYFLLLDNNDSKCQLEPIIDDSDDDNRVFGIKISRKLVNGYIHALIFGEDRDSDRVIFHYSSDLNSDRYLESIEIECSDYSTDTVRDAVRTLLKLDKNATKQKNILSLNLDRI